MQYNEMQLQNAVKRRYHSPLSHLTNTIMLVIFICLFISFNVNPQLSSIKFLKFVNNLYSTSAPKTTSPPRLLTLYQAVY